MILPDGIDCPPVCEHTIFLTDVGTPTMLKVTKAVFPVAGLGARFLPTTKASPKEMVPVADKPLIQYTIEEAITAGITGTIFVTSHSRHAIETELEARNR
jgi:UTP--glucose-1-phosphate uridylyltransferase